MNMRPGRKEDESVQTSLRELMKQEEERVRAESDRLAQLRAAKIRIDEERAAAAREAEELRQAELEEAKKAEATERARLEMLARTEADRRAAEIDERVRIAAVAASMTNAVVPAQPPSPPPQRFVAGMMTGLTIAMAGACAFFFVHEAPRLAAQEKTTSDLRADLDRARAELRDLRNADHDAIAQRDADNQTLRAENDRLRAALDLAKTKPTKPPTSTVPVATSKPHHEKCADPHDPLCGDLDAR